MRAHKQLKILFWNAQSITNMPKRLQLEYVLFKENIDIVLIADTFLEPTHTYTLKGYRVYRNDRLHQPHGGVAIAVRNGIQHKLIQPFATDHIENIGIELVINHTQTNIIVAYNPYHTQNFVSDIELLTSTNKQFMLLGDLNAKHISWNCAVNNKAGNELFNMQQTNEFMIHHTSDFTHFPHSGHTPSTIDILLSNVNFSFDFLTHPDQMSSDHTPTICHIEDSIVTNNKRFDYRKANWRKFRQIIDTEINSLIIPVSKTEIESSIESFSNIIQNAQNSSVPVLSLRNKPQINVITKQLIQHKNNLIRLKQRTSDTNSISSLKTAINALQRKIKKLVVADFNDIWNEKLNKIPKGGKKMWKLAKEFKGKTESNASKIKITRAQSISDPMNHSRA